MSCVICYGGMYMLYMLKVDQFLVLSFPFVSEIYNSLFSFQGLLWALAVLFLLHENDESAYNNVIKTSYYSDHQATELAILGAISMTITIINVVCIYVVGYSFLKVNFSSL